MRETRSGFLRGEVVAFEGVVDDVEELRGRRRWLDALGLRAHARCRGNFPGCISTARPSRGLRSIPASARESRGAPASIAVAHRGVAFAVGRVAVPLPEALGRDLAMLALQQSAHVDSVELAESRGGSAPAIARSVGSQSVKWTMSWTWRRPSSPAGHRITIGSRIPPSYTSSLRAGETAVEAVGAHLALAAELRTVVAREHHDRVVREPGLIERFEHARDAAIHAFDHRVDLADGGREIAAGFVRRGVSLGRFERKVRRVVGEVEKKRVTAMAPDELRSPPR